MAQKIDLPALARAGTRRKSLLMNPIVLPQTIEDELYAIYRDGLGIWQEQIKIIGSAYTRPSAAFTDADGQELSWLIDQAEAQANSRILYQTERLGRWVTRVGAWHGQKTISAAKSATGVEIAPFIRMEDIRPKLDDAIRVNVSLISNINSQTKERVQQVIFNGLAQRKTQREIVKELSAAMGITQRRARRIARDQSAKLNSVLTQYRNEQLSIESYIWRTRRDDRVRHSHEIREGRRFLWSKPPFDGHPSFPVGCRCTAQSVLIAE